MDLGTQLVCREATRATRNWHRASKNLQDIPMTKNGNIAVKKSEFQSVNLVISKLTAMFKSFHHILVRITNWCIFLHFRYVCNCYCSLLHRPSFYFLPNISRNILKTAKWLPSWRVWPEYAQCLPHGSAQDSEIQAATKLLKGGNIVICGWWCYIVQMGFKFCDFTSINYILV